MNDELTPIADKVRGVAAAQRCSQSDVAAVLGLSRQAVNLRYNGKVPFAAHELLRLARRFRVPVSSFFPESAERAA